MARLKLKIQRPWIPYIIFIITLVLTLLITAYINKQTYTEDNLRFLNAVQDTNTNIRTQIETYIAVLRGTAGLFSAELDLSKSDFVGYVTRLRLNQNYSGAMGIGFAQRIQNSDKDSYIQAIQQEDNEQFTITPAGDRSEYYVNRFIVRTDNKMSNRIGVDLFADPEIKGAMEKARDSGLPTSSEIETKVESGTSKKISVFAIFTPIYQGGTIPATVTQRRNSIFGFVYIPFNVTMLLKQIVGGRTLPQLVNYQIYDNEQISKKYLLYDSISNKNQNTSIPRFKETRKFSIGGTYWIINYTNSAQFDTESSKNFSTIIFLLGLFISIMFFSLSRSQYIARTRAEIAASKLQAYQKELQKAINHRDNFISIASHELKTPVTSLKVYAELLLRQYVEKGDKKTYDYLLKINRQIDKLTALIQDLLNVSRIQKNQLTFRMELCDLNEIAKEAVENTQQITDHHKLMLEGRVKKKVICDKERISQVMVNLLTNAIKYSPTSEKILVKLDSNRKEALISVTDYGIGISKEYQKKVFDRFYRVSDTDGQTYPGLGIGLFISQAIVKRHEGNIIIISEKGQGSTFTFNLPFKKKKKTEES